MEHIRRNQAQRFNVTNLFRCVTMLPVAVTERRLTVSSGSRASRGRRSWCYRCPQGSGVAGGERRAVVQALRLCCLLSTLVLILTACASRPAKEKPLPTSATPAAHGTECHSERATGSLIPATVCTTAEERARQAAGAQETKDWLNNVKAGACAPTGPCK